jgi:hypothetical protein
VGNVKYQMECKIPESRKCKIPDGANVEYQIRGKVNQVAGNVKYQLAGKVYLI